MSEVYIWRILSPGIHRYKPKSMFFFFFQQNGLPVLHLFIHAFIPLWFIACLLFPRYGDSNNKISIVLSFISWEADVMWDHSMPKHLIFLETCPYLISHCNTWVALESNFLLKNVIINMFCLVHLNKTLLRNGLL